MKKLFTVVLLLTAPIAAAYEYEIEEPVLEAASTPGHESLTSLAIDCLKQYESSDKKPSECLNGQSQISEYRTDKNIVIPSISADNISAEELMDVSSWPDDPTRLGSYLGAITNLFQVCDNLWSFLGFDEHYENISGGLACNSHYGLLQFFHAQASSDTEPYLSTRNKILAWIRFNYSIVRDQSVLAESYCPYFNKLKQDKDMAEMANAFLPDDYDDLDQCEDNYSVNWIYSSKCTSLLPDEQCENVGDPTNAQITALGAIIHVIQDSYSLSHTKRDACSNGKQQPPVSKISCAPIDQYYNYNLQDASQHNVSDELPIKVDASCLAPPNGEPVIDDAVTATATVLWYAMNGKKTAALIDYVDTSVFRSPYQQAKHQKVGPQAGAGVCYLPIPPDAVPAYKQNEADFRRRLMGQ